MRFAVFGAGGLGAYYGARLVEAGYRHVGLVESLGEFAVRGGI